MTRAVRGSLSVHPRGFGFLPFSEGEEESSAFVTPPDLNGLLAGDVVDAEVELGPDGRFTARHVKLVARARAEVFGHVLLKGNRPHLRLDRSVANWDAPIEGAPPGLRATEPAVGRLEGGVVRDLRVVPATEASLERILVKRGLPDVFPADVQAEAVAIKPVPIGARRDLRAVPTVTIDAAHSRDLDDALAVLPAEADGAIRLFVSIADVDAFAPEGSALDLEARRRGTSVYLAGRVLNMIPPVVSERGASLLPGEDRPALTVELRIDPEGAVRSVDVYESMIRSAARLTYDAAATFLDGEDDEAVPEVARAPLRWLRAVSARLSVARASRGGIEVLHDEAYVTLDAKTGEPVSIEARQTTSAHRLVERVMVAANEAVARWLTERGLPGIFRVHPPPTPERTSVLEDAARACGVEPGFGPTLTPRSLAAFDAQTRTVAVAGTLAAVTARVLGPALYTAEAGLHFGLAAPLYLHFTSPIRRYADLVVHRVVKAFLAGRRDFKAEHGAFAELAAHLNARSRLAEKAELERLSALAARHFASRVGEVLGGRVVDIKPFGLVVLLSGTGVTGTIALDQLEGGPFTVQKASDGAAHELAGATRTYRLGQGLRVRVAGASEELARIELALEERGADHKREGAPPGASP